MAKKLTKRCLLILVKKEMQIKSSMAHHFTFTTLIKIKKKKNQVLVKIKENQIYLLSGSIKL